MKELCISLLESMPESALIEALECLTEISQFYSDDFNRVDPVKPVQHGQRYSCSPIYDSED